MNETEETFVPHVGWLRFEAGDDVARYLREGWFEYREQAFLWLYLRPGDVVIDGGAHVGLFTLLAARVMADRGRVIAVEPNPASADLLRGNLAAAGVGCVEVLACAISDENGTGRLHVETGARAPYTRLGGPDAAGIVVQTRTLDALLAERALERVDLVKLDVEGAELEALAGGGAGIGAGRMPVLMIEFTESNQRTGGRSTRDVAEACMAAGLRLSRLDPSTLALEAVVVGEPIEYENLIVARDTDAVDERLRTAPAEARRTAREILRRGRSAFGLLERACAAEHLAKQAQDRLAAGQPGFRELAKAAWRSLGHRVAP